MRNDFSNEKVSQKFSSLKRNLRVHLKTLAHSNKEKSLKAQEDLGEREDTRNRSVGMKIGRLIYYLLNKARADDDLPTLIYLTNEAGADMGDFSHSHNMVAKLLPFFSAAVEKRLKTFLSSRMLATGCLPRPLST